MALLIEAEFKFVFNPQYAYALIRELSRSFQFEQSGKLHLGN